MDQKIAQLHQMLEESRSVVFFGGAGVSTESGIPDFRSVDGLYHQKYDYPPEVMLSHSFYETHTAQFYDFYRSKMLFLNAKPGPAHLALARLEALGRLRSVVTQNIDGLHQLAGSKRVWELHGSVHRNYCQRCHKEYDAQYILHTTGIPTCDCGGVIKPDVVLYEEGLDSYTLEMASRDIQQADLLIIGGTSLAVYPAAGLIHLYQGDRLVVINKSPTPADTQATLLFSQGIGQVLSQAVEGLSPLDERQVP